MIYVASSWRNPFHTAVVAALKSAARQQDDDRFLPYDFRNPGEGATGFHWTEVGMPTYDLTKDYEVPVVPFGEYQKGLAHPIAEKGFRHDIEAMKASWACVLVLPCGRSAHLEAGWMIGQGKFTAILMSGEKGYDNKDEMMVVPELMYKMADAVTDSLFDLLGLLGVKD